MLARVYNITREYRTAILTVLVGYMCIQVTVIYQDIVAPWQVSFSLGFYEFFPVSYFRKAVILHSALATSSFDSLLLMLVGYCNWHLLPCSTTYIYVISRRTIFLKCLTVPSSNSLPVYITFPSSKTREPLVTYSST